MDGIIRSACDSRGVCTVTLDHPRHLNALTRGMITALGDVFEKIARDPDVRVTVVTGAGANFSAGGDISESPSKEGTAHDMAALTRAALALHDLPMPVIAVVRGHVIGAALGLLLGCDIALGDATVHVSTGFVRRGLSPDLGASWLLVQTLGQRRAIDLVMRAPDLDAQSARELGILSDLSTPGDLDAMAEQTIDELISFDQAALARTKSLLREHSRPQLEAALAAEQRAQVANVASSGYWAEVERFVSHG